MSQEPWQLTGAGAESYELYQVPSVFGPLAEIFLARMDLQPGQRVLDVACGTGVLARQASPILGPTGSIVGVDLNSEMLDVARTHAPASGATVEWREGDAVSLPCRDGEFDTVLCQQGLQFIPDKTAALREMHRVLKSEGVVGLCVWRGIEHSPFHSAIAQALKRHINADVAERFQAPFGFGDSQALESAISNAGFLAVDIQIDNVMRQLLPPEESVPGLLASTPVGPDVVTLAADTRDTIVSDVAAALSKYRDGDGFLVPQSTHIAVALKA